MSRVVLPAFSLLPSNCGESTEVWSVLERLDYEVRYSIYNMWWQAYDEMPEVGDAKWRREEKGVRWMECDVMRREKGEEKEEKQLDWTSEIDSSVTVSGGKEIE